METKKKLAPLKGFKFIEFHREFAYFFHDYELNELSAIEEKPGVAPSAARLANVAQEAKSAKALLALSSLHSPENHLKKFSELSDISYKRLPIMVQKKGEGDSIAKLQALIAGTLLNAKPKP